MAYLILANPGSESRKYSLYKDSELLLSLHLEKKQGSYISSLDIGGDISEESLDEEQFLKCSLYLIQIIKAKLNFDPSELTAIGVRIVAPGKFFTTHRRIDDAFIINLEQKMEVTPLHIQASQGEIKMFQEVLPHIPLYGISDSAFHSNRPEVSRLYAIPRQMRESLEAERFGYHGLSAEYVIAELKQMCETVPEKLVVCHMGGGISVMAFKDGKTVDTSMGFSPLEGVMMATRSGDVDVALIFALMEKTKSPASLLETLLNRGCGLLGLSGISEDPRDLLRAETDGNKNAKMTLDLYVYRIKKMIGAMVATLDGIDTLVFTGTVGERSYILRSRICSQMNFMCIEMDEAKNLNQKSGTGEIGLSTSKTKIFAMKCDEMKIMAQELTKLL